MGALIADKENFRARISLTNFLRGFVEICPPEKWRGEVLNHKDRQEADFLLAKTFKDLALVESETS
jgi:hypothetical protein